MLQRKKLRLAEGAVSLLNSLAHTWHRQKPTSELLKSFIGFTQPASQEMDPAEISV